MQTVERPSQGPGSGRSRTPGPLRITCMPRPGLPAPSQGALRRGVAAAWKGILNSLLQRGAGSSAPDRVYSLLL